MKRITKRNNVIIIQWPAVSFIYETINLMKLSKKFPSFIVRCCENIDHKMFIYDNKPMNRPLLTISAIFFFDFIVQPLRKTRV